MANNIEKARALCSSRARHSRLAQSGAAGFTEPPDNIGQIIDYISFGMVLAMIVADVFIVVLRC